MENIHLKSGCESGTSRFKVSSTIACRFLLFPVVLDCDCFGHSQGTITGGTFSLVARSLAVCLTVLAREVAVVDMCNLSNIFAISAAFRSCRLREDVGTSWLNADPAVLEKRASYLMSRFKSEISLFINM